LFECVIETLPDDCRRHVVAGGASARSDDAF